MFINFKARGTADRVHSPKDFLRPVQDSNIEQNTQEVIKAG